ncbi:MAG: hypothetical protein M1821_000754 [Bathelium mastoideum]|nr:MAG: hypothetical protein M1821_000754 [Bathelium mastoideum]
MDDDLMQLTLQIRNRKEGDKKYAKFHGDKLIANKVIQQVGLAGDLKSILGSRNWSALRGLVDGFIQSGEVDGESAAQIAGNLSNYSSLRQRIIDSQVKSKYDRMLHPPLTYLGDAFQYRTADGKFNSVINPHLGQAGAPYAKTVPSKTAPLGALPDPGDLFDKLMAREEGGRPSTSGLSSMLIYHATIIIHDIFRTNDNDKNISDSSSYLDLSPLYGYTMDMQRKIRDDKYKLGLLKPDAFAEDRLLRQPPGVCVMLVMYNRYHNYAAKQLHRINENGRFSIPTKYADTKLVSLAKNFSPPGPDLPLGLKSLDPTFAGQCDAYDAAWKEYEAAKPEASPSAEFENSEVATKFRECEKALEDLLKQWGVGKDKRKEFEAGYDAAWTKLDDDLFNTARLITCGMYIQISVHDYLRALMGFHQFNTNFTLDPRSDFDQKKTTRGLGNQVTVEFNLLYRFHCAISLKDEKYTEDFIKKWLHIKDPANASLQDYLAATAEAIPKYGRKDDEKEKVAKPWQVTFGIPGDPSRHYERNKITNLFDDDQLVKALTSAMDDPISNFGPRNIPKCLKPVEIMGITQARRWEVGTLNDFREFFGLDRHGTFESISKNVEIQNALRDLYENPDKVELYPGIFCESDQYMGLDPGPSEASSALWTAIFSDAITLVRSDRFYTVDWNTNSLTSWGMKEVTPDDDVCKSSVFHRLIQRAFPGWFDYDSIRFFHPFYTSQQNAVFAKAQGYTSDFKVIQSEKTSQLLFDTGTAKPEKPIHLTDFNSIALVLNDTGNNFLHPALLYRSSLPTKLQEILTPKYRKSPLNPLGDQLLESTPALRKYLDDLMRSIVRRESISMTNSTFQIDATRDFAIPVVTRYVADFLGFGHLLHTENNSGGSYSENEIYQHITNCQVFLSYNADETKMLKRRKAFKTSMSFLIDLTLNGNVAAANQWGFTRALFGRKRHNPMTDLGYTIAETVLKYESDAGKAAAILLLVCLDFAYNSVVSFTAVVDDFMRELYEAADSSQTPAHQKPRWLTVQELAFSNVEEDQDRLEKLVQQTARRTVRLPILRTAVRDYPPKSQKSLGWTVTEGQTVILNIHQATVEAEQANEANEIEFLALQSSFAGKFGAYKPRRFAILALTSMVKFIAQMKNPRRGHDAQGRLKKVNLHWTAEGYSNFMAPLRMERIAEQVKRLPPNDPDKNIFTMEVLKPETDTYLTPSWDEMVPFPMTWKIRFDGFGKSDYSADGRPANPYGMLRSAWLPDDAPPWYQPQGVSHIGGSFADVACTCANLETYHSCPDPGKKLHEDGPEIAQSRVPTAALREPTLSTGCSLPTKTVPR